SDWSSDVCSSDLMYRATQNRSRASHHTISGHDRGIHTEQRGPVLGEQPRLLKAERVNHLSNPLPSSQLARRMLLSVALLTTPSNNLLTTGTQLNDPLPHRH